MSESPDEIKGQPEISEAELMKMFPTAAKIFAATTISDFFKGLFKEWAKGDANVENTFLGIFSGLPFLDCDVPEWVKRASRKFFEGTVLNGALPDENADWVTWLNAIGFGFGLIEDLLQNPNPKSVTYAHKKKVLAPMMGEIKTFASNAKAEESAAFFGARLKGEKRREFAEQITVPTKICFLIAVHWQIVAKMNSTAELHTFLLEQITPDGQKLLPSNVDSRETRRICKNIGRQFENPWNKKKSKI